MKRIFLLTICAALFLCSQFLLNCSSPLDSSGGFTPSPPRGTETLYVHDTVFLGDSICDTVYDTTVVIDTVSDSTLDTILVIDTVTDTLVVVDSIIVVDTVLDTVFIPNPDSCVDEPICAEFNKHNKKIYWKLNNESGLHRLEFTASFGDECFDQLLHIHVKGKKHEWDPKANPVFTLDEDLRKDAKIMIHCKKGKHDDGGDSQNWGGDDDDCDDGNDHDDDDDHKKCCNVEVCLEVTPLD